MKGHVQAPGATTTRFGPRLSHDCRAHVDCNAFSMGSISGSHKYQFAVLGAFHFFDKPPVMTDFAVLKPVSLGLCRDYCTSCIGHSTVIFRAQLTPAAKFILAAVPLLLHEGHVMTRRDTTQRRDS